MKKVISLVFILFVLLFIGCQSVEPVVTEKIIVPDLSVFRYDVYEFFPLIDEPQTDSDLMYNSLIIEMSDAITNEYATMLEEYNKTLKNLLSE